MSAVNLDSQERNTILAALRTYQAAGYGEPCNRPLPIHDIATNMDMEISMNAEAIDELCEKINCDCSADSYEQRVRAYEAEGMTRSDAQAVADADGRG